jgi:hypothetical protein
MNNIYRNEGVVLFETGSRGRVSHISQHLGGEPRHFTRYQPPSFLCTEHLRPHLRSQ